MSAARNPQGRVLILLAAGVLLVGLGVWVASSRHDSATLAGDVVLPGAEAALNKVTEVHVIRGDGTRTTLKPGNAGWSVAERDYPADTGKVRKLLLDLGSLNVVEEKTSQPANYPALGVEDVNKPAATGTQVELVTPAKTYALIVGKSSSGKSGYVRLATSKQSLLAAPLITVDADPKRWLDPTLLDLQTDRVKSVEVKLADGPAYTVTKDTKNQQDFAVTNIPKGRQLSAPAAADVVGGALAGLTLDDVHKLDPANADAKLSQVVFHTFDGLDLTVAGRKDGARTLISLNVHASGKDAEAEAKTLGDRVTGWEFDIPSYKYDAIFKPLEDLLAKPPEAARKGADKSKDKKSAAPAQPGGDKPADPPSGA
jgi:hypothetical protein